VENILSGLKFQPSSDAEVEAYKRKIEAEDRRARGLDYASIVSKACFPLRYAKMHEQPRGEGWMGLYERMLARLGTGMMVAFTGRRGTGKTQMAAQLGHSAAKRGMTVRYTTAMNFFLEVKGSWANGSKLTELEVIRNFAKPALLILDEVQERGETGWEDRLLTNVLDRRYADLKDTIVLTNQVKEKFAEAIGDSNASRISEMGGIAEFNWPSYRTP